ncbi:protein tweety-2 [Phlebotomus papatasi]|uniref:protein tweety-2 n=1 Tax=Phlebotomus papatasi TaxID=29031 RepID=UPI0024834D98|nr:protein tweety-2 [Phlebotomus papatasi]
MEPPSMIVRLLHSVPRFNITLHRVSNAFNPNSDSYIESLGILASIPAAVLIVSLIGLLLYLLTRCCDRKPRRGTSNACQKCTLLIVTILCGCAIGLGLYGNDDLHNGVLQVFGSGRQVEALVKSVRNQTDTLKHNLKSRVVMSELEDIFDKPTSNQTALTIVLYTVRQVKDNTTLAINALEAVSYFIRSSQSEVTIKNVLDTAEFYESIRWPVTLGFLAVLLLLCTILIIGVARSSRCALIFFSVFGLLGVTLCWLLSSIYLAGAIALGDFCVKPNEYICSQQKMPDIHYMNCGTVGTNPFILRLNESRDNVDHAKDALQIVSRISMDMYPRVDVGSKISHIQSELDNSKRQLMVLSTMLDPRTVQQHYNTATKGLCGASLFGLALMLVASLFSAFFLTILVCVDSHAWIYLAKKRPYGDKSETTPLFPSGSSMSPTTAPILSGTSTINRTLLHHQQQNQLSGINSASGTMSRNGTAGLRGLEYSGDSPPPDYNVVVHGNRTSTGHHTLGRLPSQQSSYLSGPNNGKYATLSKQCKTLESNDFY